MHRNYVADAGITTPKQVAKSMVNYSKRHPEVGLNVYYISQVPGTPSSKPVHGVFESIVRSKKYLVPLAFFHPVIAGGLAAGYLAKGRFNPERYAKQAFYIPPDKIANRRLETRTLSDNRPQMASDGAFSER
jgi:hypothetical protein